MNGIFWTEEMISTLRTEFPTALNNDLAKKLGVSKRTLNRKATELGLAKTSTFMNDNRERINYYIRLGQKTTQNTNWLKTRFQKGRPANEYTYKAGVTCKERLGEEREKARREKCAKTRAATFRLEKARAAFCLPQKTKLKVTQQSRRKICQNHYLRKRGYKLDIQHGIAYYDENTLRAWKIESKHQYFKFQQWMTT